MPFLPLVSGRFTDPFGSGISGVQLFLTSKATSRGPETVAKTAEMSYTADANGDYSFRLASGYYKIDYQQPEWLKPERLGVATVSGVETIDLGTLIGNSVPPPSELGQISDVDLSGRINGGLLQWSQPRQRWISSLATGQFATSGQLSSQLAATGSALVSMINRKAGLLAFNFTPTSTTGTSFANMMSATISGGTLSVDGDRLRITSVFSTPNTGEKRFRAYFGDAMLCDVSDYYLAPLVRPPHIFGEVVIVRTSATGQNVYSQFSHDTRWLSATAVEFAPQPVFHTSAFSGINVNVGNTNTFKFTASGEAGAGDITQKELLTEFLPAP